MGNLERKLLTAAGTVTVQALNALPTVASAVYLPDVIQSLAPHATPHMQRATAAILRPVAAMVRPGDWLEAAVEGGQAATNMRLTSVALRRVATQNTVDALEALIKPLDRSLLTTTAFEISCGRLQPTERFKVIDLIIQLIQRAICDRTKWRTAAIASAILSRFGADVVEHPLLISLCNSLETLLPGLPDDLVSIVDPISFLGVNAGQVGFWVAYHRKSVASPTYSARHAKEQMRYFGGRFDLGAHNIRRHYRERAEHLYLHDFAFLKSLSPRLQSKPGYRDLGHELIGQLLEAARLIGDNAWRENLSQHFVRKSLLRSK